MRLLGERTNMEILLLIHLVFYLVCLFEYCPLGLKMMAVELLMTKNQWQS